MTDRATQPDPFGDGYIEEPPAPEPRSVLSYATPALRQRMSRRPFLLIGHRCAVLAFLALAAAIGLAMYGRGEYWHLLLVAFIAADLGLLCGLIASWLRPAGVAVRQREPIGLIVFSLLLLIPTMILVTLAKTDRLIGWIDATWKRVESVETWAEERLNNAATPPPASPG